MSHGTHDALADPRNDSVLIWLNGELVPRAEAKVSVFDSGFMLGDGVWEGLRLHNGRFAFLDQHLDRLFEGARTIDMDLGMTRESLTAALHETALANGMTSGVHIRLMATRGPKKPRFRIRGCRSSGRRS
jgi:branched-chain amino acid aminotransferase